jgi:uncharacterized delta-60 repeat protein
MRAARLPDRVHSRVPAIVLAAATPLAPPAPAAAAPGDLDPSFGTGGIVRTPGVLSGPTALKVQPDGRIVVAGFASSADGDDTIDEDFALARYAPNGGLDATFGAGGKVTTDTSGGNDSAQAVALQADGKIVAAGVRFTLARYLGGGGAAPTVAVVGGACRVQASARVDLRVHDSDSQGTLAVSATSSDQRLVPTGRLAVVGAGEHRALSVSAAPGRAGTATVTISVSDGTATTRLALRILVGTRRAESLAGGGGTDVIFGRRGADRLQGAPGADILCGGRGRDALTGGPGADVFSGGRGADRLTDFARAQGDTWDGT